jgi:hypothetical protein
VIRRLEIHRISDQADEDGVSALAMACRHSGRYIAEVLYSAVGWSVSERVVRLVWEHAFASPEAYQRYMVHPFHADVLDRYLLHDSPERVVTDDELGAGLVGYHCDKAHFVLAGGIRRLVLLRLGGPWGPEAVDALAEVRGRATDGVDPMSVSVIAANSLGSAWFDGVTPMAGPPRWTHLWEQGFAHQDDLRTYLGGNSPLAQAEREDWEGWSNGIVEEAASLTYEIDGRRPDR